MKPSPFRSPASARRGIYGVLVLTVAYNAAAVAVMVRHDNAATLQMIVSLNAAVVALTAVEGRRLYMISKMLGRRLRRRELLSIDMHCAAGVRAPDHAAQATILATGGGRSARLALTLTVLIGAVLAAMAFDSARSGGTLLDYVLTGITVISASTAAILQARVVAGYASM